MWDLRKKHLQTMPGVVIPRTSQPLGKSRFNSWTVSGLWRLLFASVKREQEKTFARKWH